MCGAIVSELRKAIVEGTLLDICQQCIRFGDVVEIAKPSMVRPPQKIPLYMLSPPLPLKEEDGIILEYARKVKMAREKRGMTQEELAKEIGERVSIIQKVELSSLEPPLKLARKLEQFLKISIVEKGSPTVEESVKEVNIRDESLTIGDLLKLKK